MPPPINNYSMLNAASGMFRTIILEAEKTKLREPGQKEDVQAPEGPERVPLPGEDDPLLPKKIAVKGPLQPRNGDIGSDENARLCDERAKAFGFKGLSDFVLQLADRCSKDGLAKGGKSLPLVQIALALLSTDAAESADHPTGTQERSFDVFEVFADDGEGGLVKTGSERIQKSALDREALVAVGAALAKLVASGRLEESQIYAYANSHVCDVHATEDMASATRACLDGLRKKLESSALIRHARAEIARLRASANGNMPSVSALQKAEKLERAVEAYCKKLDVIFPRDIVTTTHTWGRRRGKALENETLYLEAQANKLTDWLKAAYSRPPDVGIFHEAEEMLKSEMSEILNVKRGELPKSESDVFEHGNVSKFIADDLCKQVKVLRNQVKLSHELAGDADVRREQELSLTKFAQNHGGRILPQRYTLDLGVSGGLLFGISASTNVHIGVGFNYQMTIDVDHAGKVTVLSVKGPKGEIGFSAGIAGADAKLGFSGGVMAGKSLVYDDIQAFLKNSSTDLRIRLHAGGFLHFGSDLNVLSRKVDNASFSALLKESGVIRNTDEFVPKAASKAVTDEVLVEREHLTVAGRAQAGEHLASGHAEMTFTGVRQTKITSDPRFKNVRSLGEMGRYQKLIRFVDPEATTPTQIAKSLADEYADFCQAVRYDAWQKSFRLRKFLNRHTAHIEPPKMSLEEHIRNRFPKLANSVDLEVTDEIKAAYLASLAATGAAVKISLESEANSSEKTEALETLAKLQQDVLQPDFKISVSARRRWLYTSTVTDLGRTVSIGGNVTGNANLHLPVVNLLGADMLGGLAPGVKFACNYQHRLSSEKTGLPHLDQDRLDFTIGTNGIKAERIITAIATSVLNKVGVKNGLISSGIAVGTPLLSPALTAGTNLVTGNFGAQADPSQRFKDTSFDLDAIMAKIGIHVGGDSGVGVRFQLVKSPDGGWTLESVQSVNYSELSVGVTASAMSPIGLGGYVALNGAYGSTSVMGERLYGTSLAPFVRVAGEFNLNSPNMKETAWNAFLDNNEKGLEELSAGLEEYGKFGVASTPVAKELERYAELVKGFSDKGEPRLDNKLREWARALGNAKTPAERKLAATEMLRTLGRITAQQLKEHPPAKGEKHVRLSEEDEKAMRINESLGQSVDVDLREPGDLRLEGGLGTDQDWVVLGKDEK